MTTWAKANSTRLLRLFVSHRVRRGHREKRKSKIKNQRAKLQSKNQNGNNRILRTGSDPFNYSQRAKLQSKNQNGNNRILRMGSDPFNYS